MRTLAFDTGLLPAENRLAAFRAGAVDFDVSAVGDPLAFSAQFRLLKLGDLNAIHSVITPIHYRRDRAMIDADGEDRVAIHYYLQGGSSGELDGTTHDVAPGGAMVWDLARTIDVGATAPLKMLIVTLPRYMLDEVLSVDSYSALIPPSAELALAADQLGYMIDHAEDLPDDAAPYLGRALRDLFAVAMLPVLQSSTEAEDPAAAPLFRRICQLLDTATERDFDDRTMARALDAPVETVRSTVEHFGGLPLLIERRRLLAAYRLLCDPEETAPVSTIAIRCGFTDMSRFSRRFRDVFHASPSDLRQYRHGGLPNWAGAYHVERNYGALIP